MLILPSDGTTFQINYREAYGKAIGHLLEKDPSVTLIAQQAFDDYYLSEALFLLDEDYGSDRVVRLENAAGIKGRVVFLCVDNEEFVKVHRDWPQNLPRPFLWRLPIISSTNPAIPEGVRVLAPATTQDAYSLTVAALEQSDETIILEHRELYNVEGYVDLDGRDELGRGKIRRVGADITLVAASWLLIEALQAAEVLAERGVNAEVVDLRSIRPVDLAIVKSSIEKTKKAILLDHMPALQNLRSSGFGEMGIESTGSLTDSKEVGTVRTIRLVEKTLGLSPADLAKVQFFGYGRTFCGPF